MWAAEDRHGLLGPTLFLQQVTSLTHTNSIHWTCNQADPQENLIVTRLIHLLVSQDFSLGQALVIVKKFLQSATMKVITVPCLEDNYAYLVYDEETGDAAAIDPVWPDQVLHAAQLNGAKVKMVLTTHHHWDHAGGNNAMKRFLTGVPIYGGVKDKVEGCTHPVEHGDEFSISPSIRVKCLETPCHTKGHISYFITSLHQEEKPAVFTGDTLFIGGCGRFFEGTPDQMYNSLCKTLASLPRETEVYCGHEYTQKNLEFALTLEPANEALVKKMEWVKERRKQKLETVPSSIREELEINPFMRVDQKPIQLATGRESPLEVMAEVRRMKDNYKGR